MKSIILVVAIPLVIYSYLIYGEEERAGDSVISAPNHDAYEVLRAVEDLHQVLAISEELAEYKVIYDGGLGKHSKTPGVWPKGSVGYWRFLDDNGEAVATLQLLRQPDEGSLSIKIREITMNIRVESYAQSKDEILASLRHVLMHIDDSPVTRWEDTAVDINIKSLLHPDESIDSDEGGK